MTSIPIALQLWSLRDDIAKDTPATLAAVAKMGYQGVETAGLGKYSPAAWAKMLGDNGLAVAGAHLGLNEVSPDTIDKTLDTYMAIGCKRLVVPYLGGEYTASLDGYRRACAKLNWAGAHCAERGVDFGYHNHDFEFRFVQNRVPYMLMLNCLTTDVFTQFDFGWVYAAGIDGAALTRSLPGRVHTCHVKAFKKGEPTAVVGADSVPWKDVFAACEEVGGTQWYVVEHENYDGAPIDCVRQCLDNLRAMGK